MQRYSSSDEICRTGKNETKKTALMVQGLVFFGRLFDNLLKKRFNT